MLNIDSLKRTLWTIHTPQPLNFCKMEGELGSRCHDDTRDDVNLSFLFFSCFFPLCLVSNANFCLEQWLQTYAVRLWMMKHGIHSPYNPAKSPISLRSKESIIILITHVIILLHCFVIPQNVFFIHLKNITDPCFFFSFLFLTVSDYTEKKN